MSGQAGQAPGVFAATSRFKAAVRLINQVDAGKLGKTASSILQRMTEQKSGSLFTEAEADQLKAMLELTSDDLDTLVSGTSYIFDQAAFFNLSGDKLEPQLLEHSMGQASVDAFKAAWAEGRAAFTAALREKTLGAPQVLSAVDWRLQVTMAHSDLSKTKVLSSILDLTLGDASAPGAQPEHLLMELSKEQLSKLYADLERVQSQLDKITK